MIDTFEDLLESESIKWGQHAELHILKLKCVLFFIFFLSWGFCICKREVQIIDLYDIVKLIGIQMCFLFIDKMVGIVRRLVGSLSIYWGKHVELQIQIYLFPPPYVSKVMAVDRKHTFSPGSVSRLWNKISLFWQMAFKFYLLCVHRDTVSYPAMACTVVDFFFIKLILTFPIKKTKCHIEYLSRVGGQTYWMRPLTQKATVVEWPWKMGHSRRVSL